MMGAWLATVLVVASLPADTTVRLGAVERDLTGDRIPEVLSLTGRGQTVDSLEVTFAITSSGRTLYERKWRMTRVVGFDAGRRVLSVAEHRARLREVGGSFFADSKFMSPEAFLSWLGRSARLRIALIPDVISRAMASPDSARARVIWESMQSSSITVFQFSPGGDAILTIGWSATDARFYNLLECC